MKIRIFLKDPDGVYESLRDAFAEAVADENPNLSSDERQTIAEQRKEDADGVIRKWIEFEENVTIEIDTETNTAIVLPVKR